MEISRRVLSVTPSVTLAISAKAKEMRSNGINVVSLSAGEPDFDTPDFIKAAAVEALESGNTKYTPAVGTLQLRQSICAKLKRDQGLEFTPEKIVVSIGAKHSIFNVLFALLNPEDEVLIPSPYWLSYPEMVTLLGGKSVFLKTDESTGFKITAKQLEDGICAKTKILILNSPSNPTGAIYSRGELEALAAVLKKHPEITIISDEIYEKLIYDRLEHVSIAQLDPEIASRTVLINGHSKAYAMTGWRLGYAAFSDAKLAKAVASIQSHSTSNPTAFAQAGGVAALEKGDAEAAKMLEVFQKRRDMFFEKLSAIEGLEPFKAQGAFYMFVNIAKTGMKSMVFAEQLLEQAHVAVVPGKPFGSDDHVRMSFAASEDNLLEAAARIAAWLAKQPAS